MYRHRSVDEGSLITPLTLLSPYQHYSIISFAINVAWRDSMEARRTIESLLLETKKATTTHLDDEQE
jgi:hypothetical protein